MTLAEWLEDDRILADAWEAKEAFYAIWDGHLLRDRERLYIDWHYDLTTRWRSVMPEFESLLWTVRNWRAEIFAYFRMPFTNAYTEAANGLIKIAHRAGRGYSFENIRRRALLMPRLGERGRWVCEGCLGQFVTDPVHLDELDTNDRICGSCAMLTYVVPGPWSHRWSSR